MQITTEWTLVSSGNAVIQKHGNGTALLTYSAEMPVGDDVELFTISDNSPQAFPASDTGGLWAKDNAGTSVLSVEEYEGGGSSSLPLEITERLFPETFRSSLGVDEDGSRHVVIESFIDGNWVQISRLGSVETDKFLTNEAMGGYRYKHPTEVTGIGQATEYFMMRMSPSGDGKSTVHGNYDAAEPNLLASNSAGFKLSLKSDTDSWFTVEGGDQYFETTGFSLPILATDDSLITHMTLTTDTAFVDVPFNVKIMDETGTVVYSKHQWQQLYDNRTEEQQKFKISGEVGAVSLPMPQPFPFAEGDNYNVVYEFKQPVRLLGNGVFPNAILRGKRLEVSYLADTLMVNSLTRGSVKNRYELGEDWTPLIDVPDGPSVALENMPIQDATEIQINVNSTFTVPVQDTLISSLSVLPGKKMKELFVTFEAAGEVLFKSQGVTALEGELVTFEVGLHGVSGVEGVLKFKDKKGNCQLMGDDLNGPWWSMVTTPIKQTPLITKEESEAAGLVLKEVQDEQQAAIEYNATKIAYHKHEHLNKAIIDSFAEDENQKLTYNGEVVGSGEQLVTQTLLYNRVTWASSQDTPILSKDLGSLGKLNNDDAFITATADGLYDVTIQLNFGNMTVGDRLSFGLLTSNGVLFPDTGQSFVTASSDSELHSSQVERTTWRLNLLAGQQLYVGISTRNTEDLTFDVYSHATHNGSYIELRQLPTQTVVAASDDVVPVTALENHYIPYAFDVDWKGHGDAAGVIFTLPAVSSDGRYFVDYGLNISPIYNDDALFAMTHIRINGSEAPWTTLFMRDYSDDVSSADFKYMNGGSYVNLVAGDVVTLYMESADNVTLNGSTSSNTHVSFIRMNQLPTHTVVSTISEEAIPVDDQAASGHVDIGTMRMQWGSFTEDSGSTFTYPVAFGNVPVLTGSLTKYGSHNTHLTFSGVSETGAIVRLRDLDNIAWEDLTLTVSWMAIGLKP